MKRSEVVRGSVAELMEIVAKKDCNGSISKLADVFHEKNIFCHHRGHLVPLALASAITPYHTGRVVINGNLVCEMDCGYACVSAPPSEGTNFIHSSVPASAGVSINS